MSRFLLPPVLWLLFMQAYGQHTAFRFRTIRIEHGLSNNRVNCILQDQLGFTWVGTDDGLNRFDGNAFTIFQHEPGNKQSIGGNIIQDLCEDKDGRLWIATGDGGLCRYDRNAEPSYRFKNFRHLPGDSSSIPVNTINAVLYDTSGKIWLATSGAGIVQFDISKEKFTRINSPLRSTITDISYDQNRLIWAGTQGGGFFKLDPKSLQIWYDPEYINPYKKLPHVTVTSIYTDTELNVWMASWDPTIYKGSAGDLLTKPVVMPLKQLDEADEATCFVNQGPHTLWVGTKKSGLLIYDTKSGKWTSVKNTDSDLASNTIHCLYKDPLNNIWIGTSEGISLYTQADKSRLTPIKLPAHSGSTNGQVYDFLQISDNRIWIASGNGLFEWSNNSLKVVPAKWNQKQPAITALYKSVNGIVYIGTDISLFTWKPSANSLVPLAGTEKDMVMKKLIASRVVSIEEDSIDNKPALLVSPYGHFITYYNFKDGVWISRGDTGKKIIQRFNIADNLIHKIYKDKNGTIWLASTKQGLGYWDRSKKSFRYYINNPELSNSLSNNHVNDVVADESGNIWVATYGGGLNCFKPGTQTFRHIRNSPNLLETICIDAKQRVWMIGNGELFAYDPESDQVRSFENMLGVYNGQLTGRLKIDSSGYLLMGGTDFFIRLHPDSLQQPVMHPTVLLTDFTVFDSSIYHLFQREKSIRLKHHQNYITLHYSAPWYQQQVYYQYQFVGIDPGWMDAGTNLKTAYQQLPPGQYQFMVRSSTIPGIWKNNATVIELNLIPPYWQRWWFYFLLAVVAGSVIYSIYRYRINELLKRQAIRNRIAQDLHDNLGSTLSSISVYSQVAKIYKEQSKEWELEDTLLRIGRISGEMISDMNDIVWAINPRNDTMEKILQRMDSFARPLLKSAGISFGLHSQPELKTVLLSMEQRKNLYLIFKEAVNNAVKYSEASNLEIEIKRNGNKVVMEIRDDGKGFDQGTVGSSNRVSLSGNGLNNMKNRARELNGEITIQSEPGKGTTLILWFTFT
jgi:ligand-binding sensor domain-containing protein/anti-sigma regulatory factor (Ser/Thr protein kinase)